MGDNKKEEVNYVAKAQNWEQRILVENQSARIWEKNWGSLYQLPNNSDDPASPDQNQEDYYQSRIDSLQKEMDKIKVPRIASWTRVSYKPPENGGYTEWQDFKRRSQQTTWTEADDCNMSLERRAGISSAPIYLFENSSVSYREQHAFSPYLSNPRLGNKSLQEKVYVALDEWFISTLCHVATEQYDALRKQRRWKDSYDCIDFEGLLLFLTQGEEIVKKEPKEKLAL